MGYIGVKLEDSICVDELFTIHYFEYMSDFSFEGESHDFWEFLCVDKGEVEVSADNVYSVLHKGDIIFHQPNEFHTVKATGTSGPNLVVISFSASGHMMDFFRQKTLQIDELEHNLLANIIIEARNCFTGRLDDPYQTHMTKRTHAPLGTEQMLRLYLEHFLIHMARRYANQPVHQETPVRQPLKSMKRRSDSEVFNRVVNYLEKHISSHITIEEICRDNLIGRSQLQKLFRDKCGQGVIDYFSAMKIDAAKQMIRTNHMNFTQISQRLGYTSIHYFSRQFKKVTGMTPSEYASSIKAMAEGGFEP